MQKSLKSIRAEKGIGQQFMANQLGISKTHYCNLENGKRRLSYAMALQISQILKVPIQNIFFGELDAKMKTGTDCR
ncbi:MAG TPA: XRE family transcriptional regulator [Pelotomaculum sp.]|nr:XRE family transcriptional regulator [Pelotomaculum sp.]HBI57334.1 XRE family transcriptional regulator [Bacillota bacterium]